MAITAAHPPSRGARLPAALTHTHFGPILRLIAIATVLGTLLALITLSADQLDRAAASAARSSSPVYLPRAEYLRPMSLGWQNVLGDVLWFKTISYFGEHYRSDRTYPWLAAMCDLITDLDPRAEHVYRFAGFILPWEAEQADAGVRLLEKGARQFPDSWTLQYYIGFHHYFFNDDYPRALAHLRRAMELPGVHGSVAQLVAVLSAEEYGPETTVAFLSELERNVDSADLREVVRQNLRDAQLRVGIDRATGALQTFRERHGYQPLVIEELVAEGLLDPALAHAQGDVLVIDHVTGTVRTASGRRPTRLHQSPMRQRLGRGESVRTW